MERIYMIANTTNFPVLLKELNIIVPAKTAVNVFELAPELEYEHIFKEERNGILGLRLMQGILVKVSIGTTAPRMNTQIKRASEKVKPNKTLIVKQDKPKTEEIKVEKKEDSHEVNNQKSKFKKSNGGMIVVEAVEDK